MGVIPERKTEVEPRKAVWCHQHAAPTAKLMPNVVHCIPLDHISGAERGDLDIWAAQDLHEALPRFGEVKD